MCIKEAFQLLALHDLTQQNCMKDCLHQNAWYEHTRSSSGCWLEVSHCSLVASKWRQLLK